MKKKFWMIAEVVMLLIWVITLFILLSQIWTNGTRCMSNPLVYGSKELTDKNNANFTCKCLFENNFDYSIFVDSKHWEVKKGGFDPFALPDFDYFADSYAKKNITAEGTVKNMIDG